MTKGLGGISICFWAQFKVQVLTYKGLNSLGLGYLRDLLLPYCPSSQVRASSETLLFLLLPDEVRPVVITHWVLLDMNFT